MSKLIGYIFAGLGIISISVVTVPQVGAFLPFLSRLGTTQLTVIAIALIIIGVFFIIKGGGSGRVREVPIYHKREIVGYRRT